MSLKALHVIFITASELLTLGFGAWSLHRYNSPDGVKSDMICGIVSFVVALALIVYGVYFLKKLKNISYL